MQIKYLHPNIYRLYAWARTQATEGMRYELRKAVEKYNTYRPHHSLAGLTPMAYIKNTQMAEEAQNT